MAFKTFAYTSSVASKNLVPIPVTTTFEPDPTCTQKHFTMLEDRQWQIWLNEPLPVHNTTATGCYPSQVLTSFINSYSIPTFAPSHILSPFVCPQDHTTAMQTKNSLGNYVACCPKSFTLHPPDSTLYERPAFSGTCFTNIDNVKVTSYNNHSVANTFVWHASTTPAQAYAHVIDGFAPPGGKGLIVPSAKTTTGLSSSSALSNLPHLAQEPDKTESQSDSSGLSIAAIMGIVAGFLGLVLILLASLFVFLSRRRKRRNRAAREEKLVLSQRSDSSQSMVGSSPSEIRGKGIFEKSASLTGPLELQGQTFIELQVPQRIYEMSPENEKEARLGIFSGGFVAELYDDGAKRLSSTCVRHTLSNMSEAGSRRCEPYSNSSSIYTDYGD